MFVAENKNREFDVVITSLVFDVVALTKQDFAKFLTNVAKLVRPGKKSNENLSLGVCKLLIIILTFKYKPMSKNLLLFL